MYNCIYIYIYKSSVLLGVAVQIIHLVICLYKRTSNTCLLCINVSCISGYMCV